MALLLILFKMNLSLLVFYLVYKLALRKLTFFNFNRIYLLAAIGMSAVIPFLEYSTVARSRIQDMQAVTGIHPAALLNHNTSTTGISITDLALSFYWAGVIVMSGFFLVQLISLMAFYRNTQKDQVAGQSIRTSKEPISPFSFLGNIFVNPWDHSPEDLQHIMDHESVHVRQWHSLDILAGELKRIFCWFNPAAWLLLRAIRENLEFIADCKVLQNGTDARQYQYALLATQQNSHSNSLSNNFNISHLKFRITMMNRSKSSDMQVLKYLLAAPAVTGLLLLTGFTQAKEKQEPISIVTSSTLSEVNLSDFSRQAVQHYNDIADTSRPSSNTTAPAAPPVPPAPPAPPIPPQVNKDNINKDNSIIFIDGVKSDIDLNLINPDHIKSMTIYKAGAGKRDKSIIKITTKAHVTNEVNNHFIKSEQPVVFLNGKRYEKDLADINPLSIKSMDVIKDVQAIRNYDATIRTDLGLILITTHEQNDAEIKTNNTLKPFQVFPNPSTHYWTIKTEQPGTGDQYELFDRNGNKKASGKLEQNTQINAAKLAEGTYFLKLRIAGKHYETRLEKQSN